MQAFLIRWMITTIAVFAASKIVPGISVDNWLSLLEASLLLGFINAILKPALMLLSLPLLILSLGLFTLVINSLLFWLVGHLVHGFSVDRWSSAFWGSLIISLVSMFLRSFQSDRPKKSSQSHRTSWKESNEKVIDV